MKPNIYIADDIHPDGLSLLKKKFNIVNVKGLDNRKLLQAISKKKMLSGNKHSSVLVIRTTRKITADFADQLTKLTDVKTICTISSGFDNINLSACSKYKIKVVNVYGGNVISAAEHTFALILASMKNIFTMNQAMRKGIFDNTTHINTEIYGKTIGVIGVGRIGSKVAGYARAFGMKVIGNDINPKLKSKYKWIKFTSLSSLLKLCDVITVHTPLDDSTYHLINSQKLKLLKKTAVIINCARGGIINENALISSLAKKISYAGIDVFENEPNFNKKFTKLDNVILTPHTAGKTFESKKRMAVIAAKNILKQA